MSLYCISYGDDSFKMSLKLNLLTARLIGGARYVIAYAPNDIDDKYRSRMLNVEGSERGAGFYAWKPYIIRKTLESIAYGDYVMYSDAGAFYVNKVSLLIKQLNRDKGDILLSGGFAPCKDWCKRDAFVYMDCDCETARNATMVSGGYVLIKKTEHAIEFVNEWMHYAMDSRIISDNDNTCGLPNYFGFRENRHDQTILSLLRWKYDLKLYRSVACVDCPRTYLGVKYGEMDGYKYSWHKRMYYICKVQNQDGFKRSKYGRIMINTRIRDCDIHHFILSLLRITWVTIRKDLWAIVYEKKEIDQANKRMGG